MTEVRIPTAFKGLFEPKRYKAYHGGRGSAKCLAKGTKVVMFDGTLRPVEDVVCGELLMGADSTARKVVSLSVGKGRLLKVKQKTAMDYVVNENHILSLLKTKSSKNDTTLYEPTGNLRRKHGRYPAFSDVCDMPVMDFKKASERFKNNFHGFKCEAIQFPQVRHDLPPYILGAWLGDGDSNRAAITSMDREVLDEFSGFAKSAGCTAWIGQKKGQRAKILIITDRRSRGKRIVNGLSAHAVKRVLQEKSLLNNKHIPNEYLVDCVTNRLELLAGLIDTDGTLGSNVYYFSNKNHLLITQVKFLADLLGFKTRLRQRVTRCNGKEFQSWLLSIGGDLAKIPVRIKRKKIIKQSKNKDWRRTRVDVEDAGIGEYFGFEIDGDHRFLLEDGTVTHNSHSFAAALVVKGAQKPLRILCLREIQKSIKDSVKLLIDDKIKQYNLGGFYTSTDTEIRGKNGTLFLFSGLKSNPEALKSMEGIDIAWVEEASTVSQKSLDLLIPTIRVEGSELWFSWNPDLPSDPVDKMFRGGTPPANAIIKQVSWRDNPYFSNVLTLELEHDKVHNPLKYQHVWEGGYDMTTERKVLRRIKENCTAVMQDPIEGVDYVLGVDLARHVDWTVLVVFDAHTHKMVYIDRFNQIDWNLQRARIEAVARRYNNALVRIDATGVGDPISGDLERAGLRVSPYVFTNNTKKNLIDNLALKLEQDDIKIIQHPELIQELEEFTYEKTASGNTRYNAPEGKHDDCVIALALAVYDLPPKTVQVFPDLLTDDDVTVRYSEFGEPIYN